MSPRKIFTGVDHPAFAAVDPAALGRWYCDVLGYTETFRLERAAHADLPVLILEAPDGTLLEVMPVDDTSRVDRTTWTPGWSHLAIRVADFDAAVAHLQSCQVAWLGPEGPATGGGRLRSFSDPEGNMLQIVWRATAPG